MVKPRLSVPLFIAALVFVLSAVAAACGGGGGGGLTLEEYFQRLEVLIADYDQRGDALGESFDEEYSTEEEQIRATQEFWKEFLVLLGQFVDGLNDIDPPSEAEAAHEESVDAGAEMLKAYQELVDQMAEAESVSELAEGFGGIVLEASGDRFEQACVKLQGIADDNDIDVDLDCGDDEE